MELGIFPSRPWNSPVSVPLLLGKLDCNRVENEMRGSLVETTDKKTTYRRNRKYNL